MNRRYGIFMRMNGVMLIFLIPVLILYAYSS